MSEDDIAVTAKNKSRRSGNANKQRSALFVAKGKFDAAELANVLAQFENKLLLDRIKNLDQKVNALSRDIAVLTRCFMEQMHAVACLSLSIDELVNTLSSATSDMAHAADSDDEVSLSFDDSNTQSDNEGNTTNEGPATPAINVFVNIPKDWN